MNASICAKMLMIKCSLANTYTVQHKLAGPVPKMQLHSIYNGLR